MIARRNVWASASRSMPAASRAATSLILTPAYEAHRQDAARTTLIVDEWQADPRDGAHVPRHPAHVVRLVAIVKLHADAGGELPDHARQVQPLRDLEAFL